MTNCSTLIQGGSDELEVHKELYRIVLVTLEAVEGNRSDPTS